MNIADRIQQLRKAKGVSQEQLADAVGVSRQAVSKWESEQSVPDIDKVLLLSEYFETTTDYLLKGIEPLDNKGRPWNAVACTVVATVLNGLGLVAAIALWHTYQESWSVGVGLACMLVGCGVFAMGQYVNATHKLRAHRLFALVNVWLLLWIPLACCYNMILAMVAHSYPWIAPVPELAGWGSALGVWGAYAAYWVVYLVLCIGFDVVCGRRLAR